MFFCSQAIFKCLPIVPQVSFTAGLSKSRKKEKLVSIFLTGIRKTLQLQNLEVGVHYAIPSLPIHLKIFII